MLRLILLGLVSACEPIAPAKPLNGTIRMTDIVIEQFGGFAGAGGAVHSRGRVAWASLSSVDQAALERLFQTGTRARPNSNLYYSITRQGDGTSETIYLLPEDVPPALLASIKTELD